MSIFLSSLMQHLIALVLMIGVTAFTLKTISPMILLLPLYMLFIGLLGVGVGWIAASLHVYVRDTAQVLAVVMTLWFWLTPIMINETADPAPLSRGDSVESDVLDRAGVSRAAVPGHLADVARIRRTNGLFGHGVRGGRIIFPAPEARLCGRSIAGLNRPAEPRM